MPATQIEQYGGAEQLHGVTLPEPESGPGQVTIDVANAGVNFADVLVRRSGYAGAVPAVRTRTEVSGRVLALGPGADGLRVGQPVVAMAMGGATPR